MTERTCITPDGIEIAIRNSGLYCDDCDMFPECCTCPGGPITVSTLHRDERYVWAAVGERDQHGVENRA